MKWLFTVAVCFVSASAFADVTFSGKSAEFFFDALSQRTSGVKKSETKSWAFKRKIEIVELHKASNLIRCRRYHGWWISNTCYIPATDSQDIVGRRVFSFGNDSKELDDITKALVELNHAINKDASLAIRGRSAERLYSKLNIFSKKDDPSLFRRKGKSGWLNLNVDGVGINEVYCQRTDWGILGYGYKCLIQGVAFRDSNAPTEFVEP